MNKVNQRSPPAHVIKAEMRVYFSPTVSHRCILTLDRMPFLDIRISLWQFRRSSRMTDHPFYSRQHKNRTKFDYSYLYVTAPDRVVNIEFLDRIDASSAYCYIRSSVVGLLVCLLVREPCKNGWTDRNAVWGAKSGGIKVLCIGWGLRSPNGKGNFWWLFAPLKNIGSFFCCGVRKNGLNRSTCHLAHVGWLKEAHGIKVGWIHSPPRGVTGRRCGLSSKCFDHLLV